MNLADPQEHLNMLPSSAKAEGPDAYIYEGIWTNWSKGRVFGSTLTLSVHDAALLSPALAILISIAGGQLWRLFQFALHQSRATSEKRNYLFHQQQVALRNTAIDINTLQRMLQLTFAWRHEKSIHSFRRSLPLLLFILLHILLVNLAGLFSSSVLNAGDQVLSRSPTCGTYSNTYMNDTVYSSDPSDEAQAKRIEFQNNLNSIFASVQQHVDICQTSVDGCDTLPVKSLGWARTFLPGECPFETSICHPDSEGTVSLDSNYISTHSDLGFNFPEEDRMAFRIVTQCAPLDNSRFVSDWKDVAATSNGSAYQIADAMYGPSWYSQRNATYSVVKQNLTCEQKMATPPYTLKVLNAKAGGSYENGTADFDPIRELQLSDGELDLILLSFGGAYNGPVSDPWFASRTLKNEFDSFCQMEELYVRDLPLTAMGCKSQWQICKSDIVSSYNSTSCTPPLDHMQLLSTAYSKDFVQDMSPRQLATMDRIAAILDFGSLNQVIDKLSQATVAPLLARHYMSSTIGSALPSDQWQNEAEYWFSILLTYYQVMSLQLGTGEFAASVDYLNIMKPSSTDPLEMAAYEICQNQIIRSNAYQNFDFFALILTIVLCVMIIALGLSVEEVIGCIRKRRQQYTDHPQDMWDVNSDIEMLKNISIRNTNTPWSRSPSGIPLAGAGSTASVADLGCQTWTTEKAKGLVHNRTTTGLEKHRLQNKQFYMNSSAQFSNTQTNHSFDGDDSTALEMVSTVSPEGHSPIDRNHVYNAEMPMTAYLTQTDQSSAIKPSSGLYSADIHYQVKDEISSSKERSSFQSKKPAQGDIKRPKESSSTVWKTYHHPFLRSVPPAKTGLFSEYSRNASETHLLAQTRSPAR